VNSLRGVPIVPRLGREGGARAHSVAAGREITKRAPAPCRTASISCLSEISSARASPTKAPVFGARNAAGAGRFSPKCVRDGLRQSAARSASRAGILAKALIRAIGVKALENSFERVRRHAGPSSSTRDENPFALILEVVAVAIDALAAQDDPNSPPGTENERCIVDQIGHHLRQSRS